jgi:hypothetical protein
VSFFGTGSNCSKNMTLWSLRDYDWCYKNQTLSPILSQFNLLHMLIRQRLYMLLSFIWNVLHLGTQKGVYIIAVIRMGLTFHCHDGQRSDSNTTHKRLQWAKYCRCMLLSTFKSNIISRCAHS